MTPLKSALLAAALIALPALASAQVTTDPAAVKAGAYKLESTHARIQFRVDHLGFSEWNGDFSGAKGTGAFDPKNAAADVVDITIPVASVSTTNATLDGELKSADWFDAAKFPAITFKSAKVTPTGAGTAEVSGALTLHGVTKPVVLKVKFHGAGTNVLTHAYTVGFDAVTEIKRSDFGVTKYVPLVGDEVHITISAPFEAAVK